ncbi:MAG: hypothetical protein PWP38_838 [Clostridiales bacterium]|nr:hypothetical protein [Clostridiales bacterium]
MRLVIKDYLIHLKEKDELDLLLCDLLLQMGYITDSKPETGNRQYGVDIRAHNEDEVVLCVVKQGNLNRKNWDADQNAVRQSLDEIKDVYIKLIHGVEREKRLHIAVVTNGVMEETVRPNWEGYVSQNTEWDGLNVLIEFWNIDKLVDDIQKYLFDEHIFDTNLQDLLRRALYFIGESDYRNTHFERIIDSYIIQLNNKDSAKQRKKKLAGLFIASQMVAQYAEEANVYKISVSVTEYLIIKYWQYLLAHDGLGKVQYGEWLQKFLAAYEKWNHKYYEAVRCCCEGEKRLLYYNSVEQRVLLYEVLGYLTSYAYYLSFQAQFNKVSERKCQQVTGSIINLVNNHPQFYYAPYDRHIGVISMLYRLLDRQGRVDDINTLIQYQCVRLAYYHDMYHKYPTAEDSFEDAVNIHMGLPAEDYLTSAFWGTMLEWFTLLEQEALYQQLQLFLKEDLSKVTKCAWFLRSEEELKFYDAYAMYQAGEGVAFSVEDTFEKLKENIAFIMSQYEGECFSYEAYAFNALEFITCRYYGYLPRVKRE